LYVSNKNGCIINFAYAAYVMSAHANAGGRIHLSGGKSMPVVPSDCKRLDNLFLSVIKKQRTAARQ
jgi:hypothetical protein